MSRAKPRFKRTNAALPAPTGNIFQVSFIGQLEGQLCVNTFYFQDNKPVGSPVAGEETDLAGSFLAAFKNNYLSICSSDYTMNSVKVQCLNVPTRVPSIYTTGLPSAGLDASGHLPTEMAVVLIRRTLFKGQSGRGRWSSPAVQPARVTLSSLTAAAKIVFDNVGNTSIAVVTGATATFTAGLVSRRGVSPSFSYGFAPCVSCVSNSVLGTVRRRKLGRGR